MNRRAPRVSVLLPVRNAAGTLDAALESLWGQTDPRFEVLAVDDGSTDRSREILAGHAVREPRLRVLENRDRGLVDALETARGEAGAPYLARMDADDLSRPDRFALQIAHLEAHPGVAAVGSRIALFPREGLGPGWRRYEAWLNGLLTPGDHARERFIESPLAHPSVMMRADAVAAAGGYRDRGWPEDYDLWLRLAEAGGRLAKVKATLLDWRHTPARLSMTSPRYSLEAFQDVRAHYLARHPAVRARPIALAGAGKAGRGLARRLREHGIRIGCFYDVDPRKVGRSILEAPVRAWKHLQPPASHPLVVAVGAPGARALIRPEARRSGYTEGLDLLFAA